MRKQFRAFLYIIQWILHIIYAIIILSIMEVFTMKALTYIEHGKFALIEKPQPEILDSRDAVVRVSLGSICTSDLHI